MKVGERGQVTIPKEIRDRFGIAGKSEVEFKIVSGAIVLRKRKKTSNFRKWKGRCRESLKGIGLHQR